MTFIRSLCLLGLSLLLLQGSSFAYPNYYDIGPTSLTNLYVDPVNGRDSNNGESAGTAFKTLDAAWRTIPEGEPLTQGVQINILPGTIPESGIPNYLESRYGTATTPIIIRSTTDRNSTVLAGDLNIFDTKYLYLINLTLRPDPAGDTFHCEQCDHILLRGNEFDGGNQDAHETIKINQSQYIYIEGSDIHGADDNAIDFVSVQHGHVIGNVIHNSNDWCQYAKGGSADLRIEANEYYDCGTGGFTAGQGTGFEFMTSPWIHYEAYDIKFTNNVVHDTDGAAIGVNGGFNILMAYNTFYRVGQRSHAIEVVFGSRSCDGDTSTCQSNLNLGGWGVGQTNVEASIPNRNVRIVNNLLLNPTGFASQSQHFAIYGPRDQNPSTHIPSPARTDDSLLIEGNVIWNGSNSLPLGIEESDQGCQPDNALCNASQLVSANTINSIEPAFVNPGQRDFRLQSGHIIEHIAARAIGPFSAGGKPASPSAPDGDLNNEVLYDRTGVLRTNTTIVGAYEIGSPNIVPPPDGSSDPSIPSPVSAPSTAFGKLAKKSPVRGKISFTLPITLRGTAPFTVTATIQKARNGSPKTLKVKAKSSTKFTLSGSIAKGNYQVKVTASGGGSVQANTTKSIKL